MGIGDRGRVGWMCNQEGCGLAITESLTAYTVSDVFEHVVCGVGENFPGLILPVGFFDRVQLHIGEVCSGIGSEG